MNISFNTKKLAKIFNSRREIIKEYGEVRGKAIIGRMGVLLAANCLEDVPPVPPPRRHELRENRKGQFAVDITKNYRLVFVPNNDPLPQNKDGGLDLKKITDVKILGVEDYHGQ